MSAPTMPTGTGGIIPAGTGQWASIKFLAHADRADRRSRRRFHPDLAQRPARGGKFGQVRVGYPLHPRGNKPRRISRKKAGPRMNHRSAHARPDRELSLPEMLADPIVQTVMARDGVTKQNLEGLIGAAAADIEAGRTEVAMEALLFFAVWAGLIFPPGPCPLADR